MDPLKYDCARCGHSRFLHDYYGNGKSGRCPVCGPERCPEYRRQWRWGLERVARLLGLRKQMMATVNRREVNGMASEKIQGMRPGQNYGQRDPEAQWGEKGGPSENPAVREAYDRQQEQQENR